QPFRIEGIEVDDDDDFVAALEQRLHQMRTDETRAAGDQHALQAALRNETACAWCLRQSWNMSRVQSGLRKSARPSRCVRSSERMAGASKTPASRRALSERSSSDAAIDARSAFTRMSSAR